MGVKVTNEAITAAYHSQQAVTRVATEAMLRAAAPHMRCVIAPVDVYQVLKRWSDNESLDLLHIGAISREVAALEGCHVPLPNGLKITEGDWSVGSKVYDNGKVYGLNIAGEDGYHIAKVSTRSAMNSEKADEGENLANALAIAAIPRMAGLLMKIAESDSEFALSAQAVLASISPEGYVHPDDETAD